MARATVVVTRPEPEASDWTARLQQAGWPTLSLPLLDVGPPTRHADVEHLQVCRAQWLAFDAVMFVSPQAVRHFFQGFVAPGPVRCWAPGPGTARALREQGISAAQIDTPPPDAGQFDSEALWVVAGPWLKRQLAERRQMPEPQPADGPRQCRVLVVRGASEALPAPDSGTDPITEEPSEETPGSGRGREWLAAQCRLAGAEVEFCVAYTRRPAVWTVAQAADAAAAADAGIWLLSSSEGLPLLRQRLPHAAWSGARALATHPRIAESARALGFGDVNIVRPALADVLRGLESWCERTD
ncbi:MAG: uroporphyrinogen-III synthase [Serpentinimonas sp.]|nr:uroporphyrinogen-III synthase [Serpentinimonas sp.]